MPIWTIMWYSYKKTNRSECFQWKSIGSLIKTSELNILLLLMTLLGTFWGYLKTFVYVYLEDLHASKLLMGLTVTISIVPSLPFLYKSSAVVQFCGHHYLIMLAFVAYCIRFAGRFLCNYGEEKCSDDNFLFQELCIKDLITFFFFMKKRFSYNCTKIYSLFCIIVEIRLFCQKYRCTYAISKFSYDTITVITYSSRFVLYHESMVGVTAGVTGTLHAKPHECFSSHVSIQTGPKDVCCNSTGSCMGLTF